jgi:hypothetical protein
MNEPLDVNQYIHSLAAYLYSWQNVQHNYGNFRNTWSGTWTVEYLCVHRSYSVSEVGPAARKWQVRRFGYIFVDLALIVEIEKYLDE